MKRLIKFLFPEKLKVGDFVKVLDSPAMKQGKIIKIKKTKNGFLLLTTVLYTVASESCLIDYITKEQLKKI